MAIKKTLSAADLPPAQRRLREREEAYAALRVKHQGKRPGELTAAEKEELLFAVAQRVGLWDEAD